MQWGPQRPSLCRAKAPSGQSALLAGNDARPARRCRAVALAGLAMVSLLATGHGRAQTVGDPADGRRLAAAWCSGCHQVDPQPQTLASDAVPSFQAVAAMPSTTSMSIRAFLSTSHAVMPDFKLTDGQIDDISAHILSLRSRQRE